MSHNYSLYAIPAYYTLAMVPHIYSVVLVGMNKQHWDNASPRSKKFDESLKKGIPPQAYVVFERCRAAHNNMLSENMAFVVGAVLAGNMAGLDGGFMNKMCGWYLVTRVAYLLCYINIGRQKYALLRTATFNAGILILFWIYIKAAGEMSVKVVI